MSFVVELKQVVRQFAPGTRAVDGISFALARGKTVALLGPSGCGKTTTLRMIAGLETPDAGEIFLDGARAAGPGVNVPPEKRGIGMVFQDYALFPHLDVTANVTFGLGGPQQQRQTRAAEMLALVGISPLGHRYPHELSGGQQQRVAIARALAPNPRLLLLDEPFSNLDAALRERLRADVHEILAKVGATALFVTHSQEEAFSLADDVIVMQHGRIAQQGPPQEVYLRPASREVASFVGDANYLEGVADGQRVETVLGTLPLVSNISGRVQVLLRPERLFAQPNAQGNGVVEALTFFGHDQLVHVRVGATLIRVRTFPRLDLRVGVPVRLMVAGPCMAFGL